MSSISSMGGSSSSNLSSLAPTGLQQAVAQQNLSVNSMNMSSLMSLSNNIPSGAGGAGASLAGLGGATPAQLQQLQQLHHPTIGPHHPLGPVSGLGQGGHYITQGGLKDY